MKKNITPLALVAASALIILSGCNQYNQNNQTSSEYKVDPSDIVSGSNLIAEIPESELSEDEKNGLILMREEEKLARDVYKALGEKWGIQIFENITESEQSHTDAVKNLLDRYQITDPVKTDEQGVFESEALQKLHDDLVAQGSESLLDALIVGATIEDLDIQDLSDLLEKTDNEDIITVYQNLQRGSRNHLRAFNRQIEKNGGDYTPQFITNEEFTTIINSQQERGGNH